MGAMSPLHEAKIPICVERDNIKLGDFGYYRLQVGVH